MSVGSVTCAFDPLRVNGDDLRRRPLRERKLALGTLLLRSLDGIQDVEHAEGYWSGQRESNPRMQLGKLHGFQTYQVDSCKTEQIGRQLRQWVRPHCKTRRDQKSFIFRVLINRCRSLTINDQSAMVFSTPSSASSSSSGTKPRPPHVGH